MPVSKNPGAGINQTTNTSPAAIVSAIGPAASLPQAPSLSAGTLALTTDNGLYANSGTTWTQLAPFVFPNNLTLAQLNATFPPGNYTGSNAYATDVGLVFSNGTGWRTPNTFVDSPLNHGGVGDGVHDDTAAVQAAINSGYCLLPAGYTWLISSTLIVPTFATVVGQGTGVSIIKANNVVGAAMDLTNANDLTVGNFKLIGTSTIGLQSNSSSLANVANIWANGTYTYAAFYFDNSFFSSVLINLNCFNANIGGNITLTAAAGGNTSGTISGPSPGNGNYIMIFSTGEIRRVTISGSGATFPNAGSGGTATWTTAVTASATATISYGVGFYLGGGFNANTCDTLVTQGTFYPFDFILDDTNVLGTSRGNTFNVMTAQGGQVGVFMGKNWSSCTFNSYYTENVVAPIIFGNVASSLAPQEMQFNSPSLGGSHSTHPQYANRVAWIQAENGFGLKINSPRFILADPGLNAATYPIVFTGGTFSHAAVAYAFANAAGVIKGVALLYPGDYTVAPTTFTVGGSPGSGATVTITTGTSPLNSTATAAVLSVTVTAGGSGYTASGSIGMVPVLLNVAIGTSIDSPVFAWGLGGGIQGIGSMLAYQSVNGSGNSEYGLSITNDNTLFASTGGWMSGNSVVKAPENTAREWIVYVNQSGTNSTMSVPIVLFP